MARVKPPSLLEVRAPSGQYPLRSFLFRVGESSRSFGVAGDASDFGLSAWSPVSGWAPDSQLGAGPRIPSLPIPLRSTQIDPLTLLLLLPNNRKGPKRQKTLDHWSIPSLLGTLPSILNQYSYPKSPARPMFTGKLQRTWYNCIFNNFPSIFGQKRRKFQNCIDLAYGNLVISALSG